MKMSTRARYGARLMVDLALDYGKGLSLLKDIARREKLSEKYLGQIIIPLRNRGLVKSGRGVHGGYMLARPPAQVSMKEIVEALEGDSIVDEFKLAESGKTPGHVTRQVWRALNKAISETLRSITLQDLVDQYRKGEHPAVIYEI